MPWSIVSGFVAALAVTACLFAASLLSIEVEATSLPALSVGLFSVALAVESSSVPVLAWESVSAGAIPWSAFGACTIAAVFWLLAGSTVAAFACCCVKASPHTNPTTVVVMTALAFFSFSK